MKVKLIVLAAAAALATAVPSFGAPRHPSSRSRSR